MAVNPETNRIYAVDTLNVPYHVVVLNGANNNVVTQIEIDGSPNGIAVDTARNLIYVSNGTTGQIDVINGSNNSISTSIDIGVGPGPLAVNPITNRIYVAYNLNYIAVVNGYSNQVIDTIHDDVDDNPVRLTVNTFNNKIYAATNFNYVSYLDVIDGDTNSVVSALPISGSAHSLSVNPINNRVYVAVAPATGQTGSVVIVNSDTDSIVSTLALGKLAYDVDVDINTSRLYAVALVGNGAQPGGFSAIDVSTTLGDVQPLASQGGDTVFVYQDILPTLIAPQRGYYRMRTPTLTWDNVDWAVAYEIEVDNNPNVLSTEYHQTFNNGSTLKATTTPLNPDGLYYWHVRAKHPNGQWGSWSPTQTFVVNG
jgi:DNA-binding beta-propeller fold protein YncE